MNILIEILLISLSSARMTRMIVTDKVFEPLRNKFLDSEYSIEDKDFYYVPKGIFGYFIHCSWCVGVWVSLLNVCLYYTFEWYIYFILVMSVAYIQGMLNSLEK